MKKMKLPEFSQIFISEILNVFYKSIMAAYRQPASHCFSSNFYDQILFSMLSGSCAN